VKQPSDPAEVRSQGPLFDVPATHLSGRTDPPTSRQAARRVVEHLLVTNGQHLALEMVRTHLGSTAKELGHVLALELAFEDREGCGMVADVESCRQRIGRRLNELEKAGLIKREGVRDGCSIWWPVDETRGDTSMADGRLAEPEVAGSTPAPRSINNRPRRDPRPD